MKGVELLQSHEPLDSWELHINQDPESLKNIDTLQISFNNLQVHVVDVGQANWNELRSNGYTVIQYDMGADLNASKLQVDSIYHNHTPKVEFAQKAVLVISHWDMDHIHCLCSMSQDEISSTFCEVWCPNTIRSNTASVLFDRIKNALASKNVHCINPKNHTPKTSYRMHHLHQLTKGIDLFIGENRRNRNLSGIVMFVSGNNSSVNYTGDCLLSQADEVLQYEVSSGLNLSDHILIAPHHGGANPTNNIHYTIVSPITQARVFISVGKNNNYGHPDAKMFNYLNNLSSGNVVRTDTVGDIICGI